MLDDALIVRMIFMLVDSKGRSAVGHACMVWPPMEDIFPLVDRLLAAGAGKQD